MDKQRILVRAVALAETLGYHGVFKRHLSADLCCGMGTINYHWGTMAELRSAMVRSAKRTGRHGIILRAATKTALGA